jgi:hypothetical protein
VSKRALPALAAKLPAKFATSIADAAKKRLLLLGFI